MTRVGHWFVNCMERGVAAILLLLFAPVLLGIWLGIRVLSGEPVVIIDDVLRSDGTTIQLYRFRTTGAGAAGYANFGRFLRRCEVDEIPALFCVLRGSARLRDAVGKWWICR
jgi:lipopolysaccharide/colanic/teichoic acid biosynthesis glycosyltransferase